MSGLAPLRLRGVNNTESEVIRANLEATFARGYKPFVPSDVPKGPVSIVGAGSDLSKTWQRIKGDIIACNSAHDFLLEKGIVPKYAMLWDANPVMRDIIKAPHPGVKYLIASRCHPSLFERFEGYDVTVWHAMGDSEIESLLVKYGRNEPMIAGGSSAVLRGTHVAGGMGYFGEMHLHGISGGEESEAGETHVRGSLVTQQRMKLRVCGKWFYVAPWMAMQAGDFKALAPLMQRLGVKLVVHGHGLIPFAASFLGCETPDIKVSWFERRIRRPIHAVISLYLLLKNDFSESPQLLGGT